MLAKTLIFLSLFFHFIVEASEIPALHWKEQSDDLAFFLDLNNPEYKKAIHVYSAFNEGVSRWVYPYYFKSHPILGTSYVPLVTSRDAMRTDETFIYDVELQFDQFSRREIPRHNLEQAERFVILGGCSFVMGEGVEAVETVAYHMSIFNPKLYPLNYGIQGSSLNVLLRQLQLIKPDIELPFKKGDLIYMYMSAHAERAAMTLPSYAWMNRTPYFEFNKQGEIENYGSMQEMRPYRDWVLTMLKKWIPSSLINSRITPALFKSDWNYICMLMKAIDKQWKSMNTDGAFLVYFHPMSPFPENLYQCLDEAQIGYVKGSRETLTAEEAKIPLDGHPSGALNILVARQIQEALLKQEGLIENN